MVEKIRDNRWETRQDVAEGLLNLVRPLKKYYSREKSKLKIGYTAAHYGESAAQMEGWARVLWGLGPLFATDNSDLPDEMRSEIDEWRTFYLEGLINGTDPDSPGYWGDIADYDQRMVETAALSVALCIAPKSLWDPLAGKQKNNVEAWLRQINARQVHANNWRFFRILVNMTFARLGLEIDEKALIDDFTVIKNCYMSDGWYYDGHDGQIDYYIPFAMHFYGLIWAALAPEDAAARAGRASEYFEKPFKDILFNRAELFAREYKLWFSDDGAEIAFGRSLTYRFAHAAFFSAFIFASERLGKTAPIGQYKHILLANLRNWFKLPITDNEGILTIGYAYPNLFMSEKYNAPGSPYWSFKAFLMLSLAADGDMWRCEEEHLAPSEKTFLKAPHMLICHDGIDGVDHTTMFPTGQHAGMDHGNCDSKYKKLVYSNRFGFSVQRGNALEDGAFDNVFAVSRAGENIYRMTNCKDYKIDENKVTIWSEPIEGVLVKTEVIPLGCGWHLRRHNIKTAIAIDTADGGFALPAEAPFSENVLAHAGQVEEFRYESGERFLSADWGSVGVCTTDNGAGISFTRVSPNTNLMAPLTIIPYIKRRLEPGEYTLVDAFYGAATGTMTKLPK